MKIKSSHLQLTKYAGVGVINTLVDFAVLNFLIYVFKEVTLATTYIYFKMVSFLFAVVNSYILNKKFVFDSGKRERITEGSLFLIVSVAGLLINIITW